MAWKEVLTEDHEAASDPHPNYQLERLTTKGDLLTYSTVDTRFAVGGNYKVLMASSGQTTGLTWGTVPAVVHHSVTQQDVFNSSTETDILSQTIPAAAMGPAGTLTALLQGDYLNNTGGGQTLQVKVKFGQAVSLSTLWDDTTASFTSSAVRHPWYLSFTLHNVNSGVAQSGGGLFVIGAATGATTGLGDISSDEIEATSPMTFGAGAEDTDTNEMTLAVSITHSTASPNLSMRKNISLVTFIS